MLWYIGNTTVRTPYRLRDALRVLQGSSLNGNLSGKKQESAFAHLLHNEGIVYAPRISSGGDVSDLGRKWRVALSQLGFITPRLTKGVTPGTTDPALAPFTEDIEGLSGRQYEITPNGNRLAKTEIFLAQQECFLRSLASYRIPSKLEPRYKCKSFSPLRFVLRVMHGLIDERYDSRLSIQEFALFVQTSTPTDGIDTTVKNIVKYREGRKSKKEKVKAYDREYFEKVVEQIGKTYDTITSDYPDVSLRYLKATGLFRSAGRGIILNPLHSQLAKLLCDEEEIALDDKTYFHALWQGAKLPTDNVVLSYDVVNDLVTQLKNRGIQVDTPSKTLPLPDLQDLRHELEAKIMRLDEKDYAAEQANQLDEIMAWFEAIPKRGSVSLKDGTLLTVPKGEAPAYLEWVIWRSFLAIDSLCNHPWDARRFQIDQDFLPVSCAPGGGPDMVFEFKDSIIVVEVTLTASSRQEAAEGEPVRRHVAQCTQQSEKKVYGLFIAVTIDSNTAHTFRSGDWYLSDDSKLTLSIVPLTLDDFKVFLASGRGRLSDMPRLLKELIIECRSEANKDAPQWKQAISSVIQRISSSLNS